MTDPARFARHYTTIGLALVPDTGKRHPAPEERFFAKVDKTEGGCWIWKGGKYEGGYGQFWLNGRGVRAHRYSFELHNPDAVIPEGMFILHSCDTPACVNPAHLRVGTAAENVADMVSRGRAATGERNGSKKFPERLKRGEDHPRRLRPEIGARGSQHGRAKLTEADVLEIRRKYETGQYTHRGLAKEYGICKSQLTRILVRRVWSHI